MKSLVFAALLTSCSPSLLSIDRPVVDAALDHELDGLVVDVALDHELDGLVVDVALDHELDAAQLDAALDHELDAALDHELDARELDGLVVDVALDHELDGRVVDVALDVPRLQCARGFEFDWCTAPPGVRPCCVVDRRTTVPLGCGCLVDSVCVQHGRTDCP